MPYVDKNIIEELTKYKNNGVVPIEYHLRGFSDDAKSPEMLQAFAEVATRIENVLFKCPFTEEDAERFGDVFAKISNIQRLGFEGGPEVSLSSHSIKIFLNKATVLKENVEKLILGSLSLNSVRAIMTCVGNSEFTKLQVVRLFPQIGLASIDDIVDNLPVGVRLDLQFKDEAFLNALYEKLQAMSGFRKVRIAPSTFVSAEWLQKFDDVFNAPLAVLASPVVQPSPEPDAETKAVLDAFAAELKAEADSKATDLVEVNIVVKAPKEPESIFPPSPKVSTVDFAALPLLNDVNMTDVNLNASKTPASSVSSSLFYTEEMHLKNRLTHVMEENKKLQLEKEELKRENMKLVAENNRRLEENKFLVSEQIKKRPRNLWEGSSSTASPVRRQDAATASSTKPQQLIVIAKQIPAENKVGEKRFKKS